MKPPSKVNRSWYC